MNSTFLAHFQSNRRPPRRVDPVVDRELEPELRALIVRSLQSFQLGEAAGGRIHREVLRQRDPALDADTRRCIQLYVEEEWRHARELALLLEALGAPLIERHWTNGAFTLCRRLLGFRVKLLTMACAEVVGIVYYRALARGAGSPELGRVLSRIAADEERHLDFQAAWFARVLALTAPALRPLYAAYLGLLLGAILAAALVSVWLSHHSLLRRVGLGFAGLLRASLHEVDCRRQALFTVPQSAAAGSTRG